MILEVLSPTLNYEAGHISALPILNFEKYRERIQEIVEENIALSHEEWNLSETSWEFKHHPLVNSRGQNALIANLYKKWELECEKRFNKLKNNEEALNRIFIEIYGLQHELSPEVDDKNVTVRRADFVRDIKSLISYAVGCMTGRYSLDRDGVCICGNDMDSDIIVPITDDGYFSDDIVTKFTDFIRAVYGADTLEENLCFIAKALGGKGTPRDIIRSYFLNDFYADHVKVYQKRPIYWLFSSGKRNAFKCLIYLHRYKPNTVARIRTEYVHALQSRYQSVSIELESRLNVASGTEIVILNHLLNKLNAQAEELNKYEEILHHLADRMLSIDLDDGVKANYAKFGNVLQTIK
jgi:type II restriction/modification system DNA methylase subunit YeeA